MYVIVVKRSLYNGNLWVAMSLYKAFAQAKEMVRSRYFEMGSSSVTFPWLADHARHVEETMGKDWWPYGMEANRKTLDAFLRYHYEQGLSPRVMTANELFAPETLDEFKL